MPASNSLDVGTQATSHNEAIPYQGAHFALGVFTLLASFIFHAFWNAPEAQHMTQQLMFMKNLAVAGGMFVVASLGAGPASVDARRAAAA